MGSNLFDAALLMALSVPVMMEYRIYPTEATPFWWFGILFFLMIGNIMLALYRQDPKAKTGIRYELLRNGITWVVIAAVLGGTMVTSIMDRGRIAPGLNYEVHDIVLQLESAVRYLGDGINPYKATYFGTPLETWNYSETGNENAVNPALYHFVMPPWYLVFSFPFYWVSHRLIGFFDGRIPLLFSCVLLLIYVARLIRNPSIRRTAVILTALSPATVHYLIEGRSDIFALSWTVMAVYFLNFRKPAISALLFALAVASKQTVWFAIPLYVAAFRYTYATKQFIRAAVVFLSVTAAVILPFLIWDFRAFTESTIFYLSGNTLNGYPISGYGLSMLLYQWGIIRDIHQYYPFVIWQLIIGGLVILITLGGFKRKYLSGEFFIWYGLVLFAFWYTSRYFNNSHMGFLSSLFILGALMRKDATESA